MGWVYLTLAILFEIAGTTAMKLSKGFSELGPSVLIFLFYGFAMALNALAMRTIELSIAYAIWSGVGTAVVAVIGFVWFKEPVTALKLASIALIMLGVIGLQLGATGDGAQ